MMFSLMLPGAIVRLRAELPGSELGEVQQVSFRGHGENGIPLCIPYVKVRWLTSRRVAWIRRARVEFAEGEVLRLLARERGT